jgi:hypothetical protein
MQSGNPETLGFAWPQCVNALTDEKLKEIADWRGYSVDTLVRLRAMNLIGVLHGHVAFPVTDERGEVVACHYHDREHRSWRYSPAGVRTAPLVIGNPSEVQQFAIFESQWDALAFIDRQNLFANGESKYCVVATRGAANYRLPGISLNKAAAAFLFGQNDEPGQRWVAQVAQHCECKSFSVSTPAEFKDLNDWTRAGATIADIQKAISEAKSIPSQVQSVAGINLQQSAHSDDLSEPGSNPFPTDCLPPPLSLIVRAVSRAFGVPEALVGMIVLPMVAGCVGKGLLLDWRPGKAPTPANAFVLLSALSGSGKSEVIRFLAEALQKIETALQEHWRKEILPQVLADLRFVDLQLKKIDRKLAKDNTSMAEAEKLRGQQKYYLAQKAEIEKRVHEPQLTIQDATVEKVAVVMSHNNETTLSLASEGRKLGDNLQGRYSGNKNMADDGIYLSSFSGDAVKVDRQGRDPVRLVNPCMTLLWAMQPDALQMLLEDPSLQQSGFLARCLIAHTKAEPQYIGGEQVSVSAELVASWEKLISNLIATYHPAPAYTPLPIQPE